MVGRRIFRPKFRTNGRSFPALESMMKQKNCPGTFLGQKFVLNALMKLAPGILNKSIYGHISFVIEPRCEKTCLWGFLPDQTNRPAKLQKLTGGLKF